SVGLLPSAFVEVAERDFDALMAQRGETGGQGCYFGECPDGQTRPQQQPTRPQQPDQPPVVLPYPQQQPTNICQTPTFWCMTASYGVVGQNCFCGSPRGPVYGVAVPIRR